MLTSEKGDCVIMLPFSYVTLEVFGDERRVLWTENALGESL